MEKRKERSEESAGTEKKKAKINQSKELGHDTEDSKGRHQVSGQGDGADSTPQVDNWKYFEYLSMPPERNWGNNDPVFYKHWLKKLEVNDQYYVEFDTIIHATSFHAAEKIFQAGELELQAVKDSSITKTVRFFKTTKDKMPVKFQQCHPMVGTNVLWYGPYKQADLNSDCSIERYGNVVFSMKSLHGFGGIVRQPGDFKYYFVEVVQYFTQCACRILVTKKSYPQLLEYNPYDKGGPWYIDDNGTHKHLQQIKNTDGKVVRNTLEFMREEEEPFRSMWLANHNIAYMRCYRPRTGVSISNDTDAQYNLALSLLAYKLNKEDNLPLQQWCYIEKENRSLLDYIGRTFQPLSEEDDIEGSSVEDEGNLALEYNLLKKKIKSLKNNDSEEDLRNYFEKMFRRLEKEMDMTVFDSKLFVKFLLIYSKQCFLSDPVSWKDLLSTLCGFMQSHYFLETLVSLIQERLFHTLHDSNSHSSVNVDMLERQDNVSHSRSEAVENQENKDKRTLSLESLWSGNNDHYKEFDTLIFPTCLKNAHGIFEEGRIHPSLLNAYSVVNETMVKMSEDERDILAKVKALPYLPEMQDNIKREKYSHDECDGKVVFIMKTLLGKEGLVDDHGSGTFNYYVIEVVKSCDVYICRILVSKKRYPHLLLYDPSKKGGPWYLNEGKHFYLANVKNSEGDTIRNKVEFYREEHDSDVLVTKWLINHEITYIDGENPTNLYGKLRLALGLFACKLEHPDTQVLQHWHFHYRDKSLDVLERFHENTLQLTSDNANTDGTHHVYLSRHISMLTQKCSFGQNGEEIFQLYSEMIRQKKINSVDMEYFLHSFAKFYRKKIFLEDFEIIYRKLILLTDSESLPLLLAEIKLALENVALHSTCTSVMTRNWTNFSYYIKHDNIMKTNSSCYVRHWLPEDTKSLLTDEYLNASDKDGFYRHFDVLVKSPEEKRYSVERGGSWPFIPELHIIDDGSVANMRNCLYNNSLQKLSEKLVHPLSSTLVYCYMADTKASLRNEAERLEKYGKDVFAMTTMIGWEGIMRYDNFNYYLLEIIDYPDESVCRILATYGKTYHGLLKIEKCNKDGFLMLESSSCMYLSKIKNFEGHEVKTKLEILREDAHHEDWLTNHCTIQSLLDN